MSTRAHGRPIDPFRTLADRSIVTRNPGILGFTWMAMEEGEKNATGSNRSVNGK